MEYITDAAVPLAYPIGISSPLAQQYEEIDEDGDLVRSYDEWGLASVLAYAYTKQVQAKAVFSMEMIIGECLKQSRHTPTENKELFRAIKREIKAGNEGKSLDIQRFLFPRSDRWPNNTKPWRTRRTMTNNLEPSVGDQPLCTIKGAERLSHDELKEVVTELARLALVLRPAAIRGPPMRPLKILGMDAKTGWFE